MIPLLIISGPVGVGKTSVGNAIGNLLEARRVAHSFVDLDVLADTYPRPPDDRFGSRLANANLAAVWANCSAAGSRNLIVARVVETRQDVSAIEWAVPGSKVVVCQLSADEETLMARVRARETGSAGDWHEKRAVELARSLPLTAPADFTVGTEGRSVADIAGDIVPRIDWSSTE